MSNKGWYDTYSSGLFCFVKFLESVSKFLRAHFLFFLCHIVCISIAVIVNKRFCTVFCGRSTGEYDDESDGEGEDVATVRRHFEIQSAISSVDSSQMQSNGATSEAQNRTEQKSHGLFTRWIKRHADCMKHTPHRYTRTPVPPVSKISHEVTYILRQDSEIQQSAEHTESVFQGIAS